MGLQDKAEKNWPHVVTAASFLGFGVILVWFYYDRGFEPIVTLLAEISVLGFFAFRREKTQAQANVIVTTLLLVLIPLLTIAAISQQNTPSEDTIILQTLSAHFQQEQDLEATRAAILQTIQSLEGPGSAPIATELANQLIEVESTRDAIPTIPAARLTLTPLVAKINSTVSAISANKVALTNPTSGQLVHDQDGLIEYFLSPVSVKSFETQVKFYNPYDATFRKFDFGILFRVRLVEGSNNCLCYRLQVNSDGSWQLILVTEVDPFDYDVIYSDTMDTSFINTGENEANILRLVVYENDAYFYLNGNYISKLNVSDRLNPGSVSIAIGMRSLREFVGNVTKYEDFTIWQIQDE